MSLWPKKQDNIAAKSNMALSSKTDEADQDETTGQNAQLSPTPPGPPPPKQPLARYRQMNDQRMGAKEAGSVNAVAGQTTPRKTETVSSQKSVSQTQTEGETDPAKSASSGDGNVAHAGETSENGANQAQNGDDPAPQAGATATGASGMNAQVLAALEASNNAAVQNMPAMIAGAADSMISQAAGLAAQSSASYFDSMSKVVLASQSVLLKQLTENVVEGNVKPAVIDAVGIIATEVLLAGAMAVAAAGGAMEAESVSFSIDKMDTALGKLNQAVENGSSKP